MFKRSLMILGRLISEKYNVRLIIGGKEASTDGESIILPNLNLEGRGEEAEFLYEKLVGYLFHETGHIRYTNFAIRPDGTFGGHLLNIIEDVRIETKMGEDFPGAKIKLAQLWEYLIDKQDGDLLAPSGGGKSPADLLGALVLQVGRSRVVKQAVFDEMAATTMALYREVFGRDRADIMEDLIDEMATLESTADSAALRDRMLAEFEQAAEEVGQSMEQDANAEESAGEAGDQSGDGGQSGEEEDSEQKGDQSGNGGQSGEGEDSEQEGDQSGNGGQSGEEEDSEQEGDQSGHGGQSGEGEDSEQDGDQSGNGGQSGEGEDSEQEGDQSGNGGQSGEGEDSEQKGDQSGNGGQSGEGEDSEQEGDQSGHGGQSGEGEDSEQEGDASDSDAREMAKSIRQDISKGESGEESAEGMDVGAIIRKELDESASQDPGDVAVPVTFQAGGPDTATSDGIVHVDQDDCRNASQRLRTQMASALQSVRRVRRRSNTSGQRLNLKRLHTLSSDPNPRVFDRKHTTQSVNTFVGVLLDRSSSMRGHMEVAGQAALSLMLGMEPIPRVASGCWAFPGAADSQVIKLTGPTESVKSTVDRYVPAAGGGTPMAQALMHIAGDVIARPETRRIITVVTDGAPEDMDATLNIIRHLQVRGVEFIGIGIRTEVGHLFDTAISINSVDDLAGALFTQIGRKLVMAA